MEAAAGGYAPVASELIQCGTNLNAMDNYGNTALNIAEMNGKVEVGEILCRAGARRQLKGAGRAGRGRGMTAYRGL